MHIFKLVGRLFAVLTLTSCASSWHGPKTVIDAHGKTVCALHRVPLTTRTAYVVNGCYLSADQKFRDRFPNAWPTGFDIERSEICPNRTTVTYCKLCNRAIGFDW